MSDKPLFIPLKGEYFDAFVAGTKDTEYRPYGPKWNEEVCYPGRRVTISRGYGKKHRRTGTIKRFYTSWGPTQGEDWEKLYAEKHKGKPAACIEIVVDPEYTVTSNHHEEDHGKDSSRTSGRIPPAHAR